VSVSRFTVLHVCVGNICRSPMAERLFALALRQRVGDNVDQFYISHGAGTGAWHEGEPMNPPAAAQLRRRGADADGFSARKVSRAMIDVSDLILCATAEQVDFVLRLRPEAHPRVFVLGEFGRLLAGVDLRVLPPAADTVEVARDRGVALVHAVDTLRGGGAIWGSVASRRKPPHRSDDLADPYGENDDAFTKIADQIERTVVPLAIALAPHSGFGDHDYRDSDSSNGDSSNRDSRDNGASDSGSRGRHSRTA
jgi:protein-tyrosine phosphatase